MLPAKRTVGLRGSVRKPELAPRTQRKDGSVVTQLAVRVPEEVNKQLKLYVVSHGLTMWEAVTEAVRDYLAKKHWKAPG
jgi:hypothetical protein